MFVINLIIHEVVKLRDRIRNKLHNEETTMPQFGVAYYD